MNEIPPGPAPVRPPSAEMRGRVGHGASILAAGLVLLGLTTGLFLYFFVVNAIPSNASEATDHAYYIVLPPGWHYSAKGIASGSIRSDFFAVRSASTADFTDNVNVVQTGTDSLATAEATLPALQQQLRQAYGAGNFSQPSNLLINGEPAVSYTYSLTLGSNQIRGEQILTVHHGKGYAITLSGAQAGFVATATQFQAMLASWRWL